jgi:two-component system response regulator
MDGGGRVLLVEDQPTDVAVAQRAFRRHGLDEQLEVARGGEEALGALLGSAASSSRAHEFKVILLDLRMPKVDGRAVLRALRADARTRHLPVVVVSSSDRETDVRECYRLGANSFVVKRFDASRPGEYLVDTARYWLEQNEVAK